MFPNHKKDTPKDRCTKKFLSTFDDQSNAKPLVSCLNLTTTSPSHQTRVQTCTSYWRTKQRVIESFCLECFLPMEPPNKQLIETSHNKVQIRAIQDWLDLNNDGRLRATHSSTDCNIQQYSNCQKSSSRSQSCHAWKSVECTVAYKAPLGHRDSDRLCHQLSLVFPEKSNKN